MAAVLAILAASAAAPAAAHADGTVTVNIAGSGKVTGAGINCSAVNGVEKGTCSAGVAGHCEPGPLKPICFPAIAVLSATPAGGFALERWSGCTANASSCSLLVNGSERVTAAFKDIAPPIITRVDPSGGVHGGTIDLAAIASDNVRVAKVTFAVRNVVRATDTSPPFAVKLDTHTVSDGAAAIIATAYDAAGNAASRTVRTTIDNTPPSLAVSGPDGQTFGSGSTQRWAITAADASGLSSVRCRVTPNAFGACSGGTTSHTASGLPLGAHTFEVLATDNAGNTSAISRRFTIAAPPAAQPAPRPVPAAPPASPAILPRGAPAVRRIFVTLAFRYRSNRRTTRLTRLAVKHVPKGATVKARCKRGCARKTYTKRHAHGTVSLKKLIRRKRLKAGTKITVTVSKRGMRSMTKQLRIRKRKSPSVRTLTSPRTRAPRDGA